MSDFDDESEVEQHHPHHHHHHHPSHEDLQEEEQPICRKRPAPSPTSSTKSAQASTASKRGKTSSLKSSPSGSSDKASRGLRHFSMMVCQKVEEKGTTTYNEVADELVRKVIAERETEGKFDEKNIRRRVYDALNVLMAMDIIAKEKKEITWRGLPSASGSGRPDLDALRDEVDYLQSQVEQKREALKELLVQQVCFRNLVWHNHQLRPSEEKIPLPFIIVNTNSSAIIQCDMSRDRTDVMFDFSMPFEINDDNTILKKMGMDKTSMAVLAEMLPDDLLTYCQEHRLVDTVLPITSAASVGGGGGMSVDRASSHHHPPEPYPSHRYARPPPPPPPIHYGGGYGHDL